MIIFIIYHQKSLVSQAQVSVCTRHGCPLYNPAKTVIVMQPACGFRNNDQTNTSLTDEWVSMSASPAAGAECNRCWHHVHFWWQAFIGRKAAQRLRRGGGHPCSWSQLLIYQIFQHFIINFPWQLVRKKIVMALVETQKNFGDAAAMQGMREPEVPLRLRHSGTGGLPLFFSLLSARWVSKRHLPMVTTSMI